MKKTKELVDLTAAWARAKNRFDDAERELEGIKAKIRAAGAKIGYHDAFLEIAAQPQIQGARQIVVIENKQLDEVLALVEGRRELALVTHVSAAKVRKLAELHPDVEEGLEAITSRDTPKFLRARAT